MDQLTMNNILATFAGPDAVWGRVPSAMDARQLVHLGKGLLWLPDAPENS